MELRDIIADYTNKIADIKEHAKTWENAKDAFEKSFGSFFVHKYGVDPDGFPQLEFVSRKHVPEQVPDIPVVAVVPVVKSAGKGIRKDDPPTHRSGVHLFQSYVTV